MSIKPAGAAGAAAASGATGEMSNFSNMEKHDKTGKYCCGCGAPNFKKKLNAPQNLNFPKWKNPFFSDQRNVELFQYGKTRQNWEILLWVWNPKF